MIKKISTLICTLLVLISCSKDTEPDLPVVLSSQNTITSFKLTINGEILNGIIDQMAKTISFNLVGAELSSLKPTIQYSEKATISPSDNENQNFNNEVTYTVKAENGDSNIYQVIIENRPFGQENKILSFSVSADNESLVGDINQDTNIINFDIGELNKSALAPILSVSEYATISPDPTIPQNFEVPVTYTVTAENGDKREYTVIANMPKINNNNNSYLYYIRANLMISGKFLDPDKPGAEIYLFDGANKYQLPIIKHENYSGGDRTTIFNLYTKIPENVPTNNNYKIIYKTNLVQIESSQFIDVVAENAPRFTSLNQNSYFWNDVLVINGENLTETIVIPSNGSNFVIRSSNNDYDYTLNNDKTQISLILDYYYLFPAYFGRPPSEKIITFWGERGRIGESFTTTFN